MNPGDVGEVGVLILDVHALDLPSPMKSVLAYISFIKNIHCLKHKVEII